MGLVKTSLDELTYKVNGIAMQVQHELKPGHREVMYQRRLAQRLIDSGFETESEKRVEVFISDTLVGYMYLDLWVEQMLVIECKAFPHRLTNDEIGQVITYLAATASPVGLLYNFGRKVLEFKRILPPRNVQDWHNHLYRCIWTPPGHSLPPMESVPPDSIRFSVTSQHQAETREASSSIRLSASSPLSDPSAPVRLSASSPLSDPSAPVRLSASSPLSDPSAPVRLSASSPLSDPSAPVRLSASSPLSDPSAPVRLSASSPLSDPSAYAASGVSIDSGNRAVELMRESVRATYGPEVLAGIGAFGGLFSAATLKGMDDPVLVASTDGVGTKVKLAAQAGRYESIGHDIVNHCINDILVQGARPLFFLDYIASSKLDPALVAAVVKGIAAACCEVRCALLGGETAEMPGVYQPNEFDVAGAIVGVVDRANILPRSNLQAGDALIGFRSSGPHTNGFSLIRKIFADVPLDTVFPELGIPLADVLLAPHRSYLQSLIPNLKHVKALAHLTGGGFIENIPRVLPDNLSAVIRLDSWPMPPLFTLIQQRGNIATEEMYRVFNMGIGMIAIVAPEHAPAFQAAVPEESFAIGELAAGDRKAVLQ